MGEGWDCSGKLTEVSSFKRSEARGGDFCDIAPRKPRSFQGCDFIRRLPRTWTFVQCLCEFGQISCTVIRAPQLCLSSVSFLSSSQGVYVRIGPWVSVRVLESNGVEVQGLGQY